MEVGDKVRVINKDDEYYGQEGVIVYNDGMKYIPLNVEFDNGYSYYDESELELLNKSDLSLNSEGENS